jgi:hypothetical protein
MTAVMEFPFRNTEKTFAGFLVAAVLILPAIMVPSILPLQKAEATTGTTDFNGDGFEDLAIGVPFEDVSTFDDAGKVNVIYGSSTGLSPTAALADQQWSQASAGIEDFSETGDLFGSALATGDFNNDGFSDLAIGAPGENVGAVADSGAVNVIYGSATGLQATSPADQYFTQIGIESEADDNFGSTLAAGDFNNDGFADVAIGVLREDVGAALNTGTVNVLYGSATGLQTTSPASQIWDQNSLGAGDAAESGDMFGSALATGDFNNDGFSDLAIGVSFEDVVAVVDAGAVNVIYGSASGLAASANQFWNQDSTNVEDAAETSDQFGSALTTGDFNSDGFSDLVIGVPRETSNIGVVHVLYGSAGGLQTTSPADQFWGQNSSNIEGSGVGGDLFGSALATGDFNNDGSADLAIGVPQDTPGTTSKTGAVNVIYGSLTGLQATSPVDQYWFQESTGIRGTGETDDFFGNSLATGDFNNDDRTDLVVGVDHEEFDDANDDLIADLGAINVLYGSASGLSDANNQLLQQSTNEVEDFIEPGDRFGYAVASG